MEAAGDKEIADRLFISLKTADHHIQHIYNKIGVSTRAAAALWAMQNAMVSWGRVQRLARRRTTRAQLAEIRRISRAAHDSIRNQLAKRQ